MKVLKYTFLLIFLIFISLLIGCKLFRHKTNAKYGVPVSGYIMKKTLDCNKLSVNK